MNRELELKVKELEEVEGRIKRCRRKKHLFIYLDLHIRRKKELLKEIQDMKKEAVKDKFINAFNNVGWDHAINEVETNTDDKVLLKYCKKYYKGYKYMINNDFDSGKCFEIRQRNIENIINYLKIADEEFD